MVPKVGIKADLRWAVRLSFNVMGADKCCHTFDRWAYKPDPLGKPTDPYFDKVARLITLEAPWLAE